eukprot:3941468-Rhodomonas_salina.2
MRLGILRPGMGRSETLRRGWRGGCGTASTTGYPPKSRFRYPLRHLPAIPLRHIPTIRVGCIAWYAVCCVVSSPRYPPTSSPRYPLNPCYPPTSLVAVCGTERAYGIPGRTIPAQSLRACYAMCGTEKPYVMRCMVLCCSPRTCYAMCGTEKVATVGGAQAAERLRVRVDSGPVDAFSQQGAQSNRRATAPCCFYCRRNTLCTPHAGPSV